MYIGNSDYTHPQSRNSLIPEPFMCQLVQVSEPKLVKMWNEIIAKSAKVAFFIPEADTPYRVLCIIM